MVLATCGFLDDVASSMIMISDDDDVDDDDDDGKPPPSCMIILLQDYPSLEAGRRGFCLQGVGRNTFLG